MISVLGDSDVERIRGYGVSLVWRVAGEFEISFEQSMRELSTAFARHLRPPVPERSKPTGVTRATSFAEAKRAIRDALRQGAVASDELTRVAIAAGVPVGTFKRARLAMRDSGEIEKCGGGGFGPPLTWRLTQASMTRAGARSP